MCEQPKGTHLNDYVAERSADNGGYLTEGVFLTAECFINGLVEGDMDDVLHKVARNQTDWEVINGRLIADGKNLPAPERWDAFHDNYELLAGNGIISVQSMEEDNVQTGGDME